MRISGESVDELWSELRGRPIYRATMSKKRFQKIHSAIRFEARNDRANRPRCDKFAPISKVFDRWNAELPKLYTLGKCTTIDEQLNIIRYTGMIGNVREKNQGQRIVLGLCKNLSDRNVTCDNFFTSIDLATKLRPHRMTIFGTIRKNREELPPILVDMRRLLWFPTYRNAIVLSRYSALTIARLSNADNEKEKPSIIIFYNKTNGGVNVVDQMVGTNSCCRKIDRWPMVVFCNILDWYQCIQHTYELESGLQKSQNKHP